MIGYGVVPVHKVVAGPLTKPDNCGTGYVDVPTLRSTIGQLKQSYPDFGGVMGWEYFNSLPGGTDEPWRPSRCWRGWLLRRSGHGADSTCIAPTGAYAQRSI